MTPKEVATRVVKIRELIDDDRSAHAAEDALYVELLTAIANGTCKQMAECARVALTTQDIDFFRWYA